jgi:hypothetical protein
MAPQRHREHREKGFFHWQEMPPVENRSSLREPKIYQRWQSFIKSVSPDFMKNLLLCDLRASVVNKPLNFAS